METQKDCQKKKKRLIYFFWNRMEYLTIHLLKTFQD